MSKITKFKLITKTMQKTGWCKIFDFQYIYLTPKQRGVCIHNALCFVIYNIHCALKRQYIVSYTCVRNAINIDSVCCLHFLRHFFQLQINQQLERHFNNARTNQRNILASEFLPLDDWKNICSCKKFLLNRRKYVKVLAEVQNVSIYMDRTCHTISLQHLHAAWA